MVQLYQLNRMEKNLISTQIKPKKFIPILRYANGKIKIKDAQGNIIVEKKTPKNKIN